MTKHERMQNASKGKRYLRQAKNASKSFAFNPSKIAPGREREAAEVEELIRQQIGVVQLRGYSRKKATYIAMMLHRDLVERVTA